jgi:NAD(P)-dependent dehydrogenase (short-subunit alcohol dehydrogenase family)
MTSEAAKHMKKQKQGLIINIGSYVSHNPKIEAGRSVYAASKFAVEGFSKAIAQELGPFGVRISCLMPGTVKTFRTLTPNIYISPWIIADTIAFLIRHKTTVFESVVVRNAQSI